MPAGGGAQLQRGDQEPGQRGHMVGGLVGGKHTEGEVLGAAPFELPAGAHAQAAAIQQHAQQGLGVVGGVPVPVITVCPGEGREVELVDHVEDEPVRTASTMSASAIGSLLAWTSPSG
jgi:hypothetical protein